MVLIKLNNRYFDRQGAKVSVPPSPRDTVLVLDAYGMSAETKGWKVNVSEYLEPGFYNFETEEGYVLLQKSQTGLIARVAKDLEEVKLLKLMLREPKPIEESFWDEVVFKSTGKRTLGQTIAANAQDRAYVLKYLFLAFLASLGVYIAGTMVMAASAGVDMSARKDALEHEQKVQREIVKKGGALVAATNAPVYQRLLPLVTRGVFFNLIEYRLAGGKLSANVEIEGVYDMSYLRAFGKVRQEGNKVALEL